MALDASRDSRAVRLRRAVGSKAVEGFFWSVSQAGRRHPDARLEGQGVEVLKDIPYQDSGLEEHLLDVYRPARPDGPCPIVLYVHGGGFRILSKESHWVMGLLFARRGYAVFNVNYRLAPRYPFPAAVEDVCRAFEWVLDHAEAYGGDASRLVLSGESAGANLVTALSIALAYERPESFARRVFDRTCIPKAIIPACGMFQVSDPGRFARAGTISTFMEDRITEVSRAYLPHPDRGLDLALADPVVFFERGEQPAHALPPFFLPCGTRDPIRADTYRLEAALKRLGARSEARYYAGEGHAFHALVFRDIAKRCWREQFEFLARHV